MDYALTYDDFTSLAQSYGRMGGSTAWRPWSRRSAPSGPMRCCWMAATPGRARYPRYRTAGQDMVNADERAGPDAMTFHWEFTLGSDRVHELVESLPFPAFLGQPTSSTPSGTNRPSTPYRIFERGGTQDRRDRAGLPLHAHRQPRLDVPRMSFGLRASGCRRSSRRCARGRRGRCLPQPQRLRRGQADSPWIVPGIDVILTGHTHDALPEPVQVGEHLPDRQRLPRQVRQPRRSGCARRRMMGIRAQADPDLLGRDRAGPGDGALVDETARPSPRRCPR
jgi:sulfur-oxidizing protein SoxB